MSTEHNLLPVGDIRKSSKLLGSEGDPNHDPNAFELLVGQLRLVKSVYIDIGRYADVLESKMAKENGIVGKTKALWEFVSVLAMKEKASRTVNSLRHIGERESLKVLNEAIDHPGIQDHAWKHMRMFDKAMVWLMLRKTNIIGGGVNSFSLKEEKSKANRYEAMRAAMPYVLMMSGGTHDRYQTYTQYARSKDPELRVKPKDGHEMLGAIMVLLDEQNLAKARKISLRRSRLISSMLAIGIIGHGETTTYFEELQNTNKAYKKIDSTITPIPDEELFGLLDAHTLDWTSISPSQLLKINAYLIKKQKLAVFDTKTGLPPVVERDYTDSNDIQRISEDTTPFFIDITDNERELLLKIRQFIAVVDLGEMLLPPVAAGFRKIDTPKAFNRLLLVQENPRNDAFEADKFVQQLFEIDGHACKSDFERQLFEAFQYAQIVHDSGLLEDPDLQNDYKAVLADAFCGTFWFFQHFIGSDVASATELVNTAYSVQAYDAAMKIYQKSRIPDVLESLEHLVEHEDEILQKTIVEMSEYIQGFMHTPLKYNERLKMRLADLDHRRKKTLQIVVHKHTIENNKPMSVGSFHDIFDVAAARFAEIVGIPSESLAEGYENWNKRSMKANIRASKTLWASSDTSVGSFTEAKQF